MSEDDELYAVIEDESGYHLIPLVESELHSIENCSCMPYFENGMFIHEHLIAGAC